MEQEPKQNGDPMGYRCTVDNVCREDKKNKPDMDQEMYDHDLQAFIHANHPLI
ncbi:hypothetical protein D3C81_1004130 [compost metagenome]